MEIRKTTEQDIGRLMEIYAYARDFMAKTGNPNQWGPTNWPPETLLRNDIKASDGSERGIGQFCINWAFAQCGHMRIDTHTDNKVMQKLLTKLSFQRCGIIYVIEDNYRNGA